MKTGLCAVCGKYGTLQRHHLFSNTKLHKKLYGKLLDEDKNILLVCESCHLWKPIPKLSEKEFCNKLGIETRSKLGLL